MSPCRRVRRRRGIACGSLRGETKLPLCSQASFCSSSSWLGSGVGWMARDRAARRAEADQHARESRWRARAWLAQDKLALARQELAEAKGRIGNDRIALQGLVHEVEALEAELATLETFLDLIDRAHEAEIPLPNQLAVAVATEPE